MGHNSAKWRRKPAFPLIFKTKFDAEEQLTIIVGHLKGARHNTADLVNLSLFFFLRGARKRDEMRRKIRAARKSAYSSEYAEAKTNCICNKGTT